VTAATLWFDAEHTHAAAGIFLTTPDGRVILQLRDDIPDIDHPGKITCFGGAAEPHETPVDCALRELEEETGIKAPPGALRFLATVSKLDFRGNRTACVFYTMTGVDPASLHVTEGKAVVLSPAEVAKEPKVTQSCRELLALIADLPQPSM